MVFCQAFERMNGQGKRLSEELLRRLETDIRAENRKLDDDRESINRGPANTYIVNLVGKL